MQPRNRYLPAGLLVAASFLLSSCYDSSNYDCGACGATVGYVGSISGLSAGTSVMLQDNVGTATTVSADGNFSFSTYVPPGFPALVGVLAQPPGQNCAVTNGAVDFTGIVPVAIACAAIGSGAASFLADFAGMVSQGSADGTAIAASFNKPNGLATDAAGNIYVADTGNSTIRKITPAGVVSTLAGTAGVVGSTDASGPAASFRRPNGVATDAAGNVYVADTYNNTIRKITPAGAVSTLAGTAGVRGSTDAAGTAASFARPSGLATDSAGNVYVADTGNSTIRVITPAGAVSTLAGTAGAFGSSDGTGPAALFDAPVAVATDSAGNLYVADYYNSTIRKITAGAVVTTLAGTAGVLGSADGAGAAASFYGPQGVACDSAGNVYVADTYNNTVRKVTSAGVVTTVVGVASQPVFNAGVLPGALEPAFGVALHGTSLYITTNDGVAVVTNVP